MYEYIFIIFIIKMSETLSNIFLNVAQAFPYIIYTSSLLAGLVSNNILPIYFCIGVIILGNFGNWVLKKSIKSMCKGNCPKWTQRPDPPNTGCGIFNKCQEINGQPTFGMPSGHAQITSFSAMFWTMYILQQEDIIQYKKIISISLLWVIALLIWISRVKIGCHNVIQVICGIIVGTILGYLYFLFLKKLKVKM